MDSSHSCVSPFIHAMTSYIYVPLCKERGSSTSVDPAFHLHSSHYHNRDLNLLGGNTYFGMRRYFYHFTKSHL